MKIAVGDLILIYIDDSEMLLTSNGPISEHRHPIFGYIDCFLIVSRIENEWVSCLAFDNRGMLGGGALQYSSAEINRFLNMSASKNHGIQWVKI